MPPLSLFYLFVLHNSNRNNLITIISIAHEYILSSPLFSLQQEDRRLSADARQYRDSAGEDEDSVPALPYNSEDFHRELPVPPGAHAKAGASAVSPERKEESKETFPERRRSTRFCP